MRVGVIADDLTGANGTGAKLAKLGFASVTGFYNTQIETTDLNSAVCIDTDSRYVSPGNAKKRTYNVIQKLQQWEADIICKRIDSTFRGNIGPEIDAILDMADNTVGIIVPSYPASKRIVVGGYLLVNGIPLQETDVAYDPVYPVKDSYLPSILEKQTERSIALVSLNKVSEGSVEIKKELLRIIKKGARLILCDAITEKHIQSIAEAMTNISEKRLIPIDSGPLTNYFVKEQTNLNREDKSKILVSVGSVTSVSQDQIEYLARELQTQPIYVRPDKLATRGNSWDEEVTRIVEEALKIMEKASDIIISTNHPDYPMVNFEHNSKLEGVTEDILAKRITAGLAEISKQVLNHSNGSIKGCFFSGGDVTSSFCEAILANGIKIIDEVIPLAAYGKIIGGEFEGLSIVTKGGLVGGHCAIYDSIAYLKEIAKNDRRNLNDNKYYRNTNG